MISWTQLILGGWAADAIVGLENGTMEKTTQHRRNAERHRILKGARITFNGRTTTIDCTVRNLSERGACLKVASPIGIPDMFDLVLDNASAYQCRVTWRKATQIGVNFT
jgi:PilZ domain-containing protein